LKLIGFNGRIMGPIVAIKKNIKVMEKPTFPLTVEVNSFIISYVDLS